MMIQRVTRVITLRHKLKYSDNTFLKKVSKKKPISLESETEKLISVSTEAVQLIKSMV